MGTHLVRVARFAILEHQCVLTNFEERKIVFELVCSCMKNRLEEMIDLPALHLNVKSNRTYTK